MFDCKITIQILFGLYILKNLIYCNRLYLTSLILLYILLLVNIQRHIFLLSSNQFFPNISRNSYKYFVKNSRNNHCFSSPYSQKCTPYHPLRGHSKWIFFSSCFFRKFCSQCSRTNRNNLYPIFFKFNL